MAITINLPVDGSSVPTTDPTLEFTIGGEGVLQQLQIGTTPGGSNIFDGYGHGLPA